MVRLCIRKSEVYVLKCRPSISLAANANYCGFSYLRLQVKNLTQRVQRLRAVYSEKKRKKNRLNGKYVPISCTSVNIGDRHPTSLTRSLSTKDASPVNPSCDSGESGPDSSSRSVTPDAKRPATMLEVLRDLGETFDKSGRLTEEPLCGSKVVRLTPRNLK